MSEKLYTEEELNKMTVKQLRDLAKDKNLKYVSNSKKQELVLKLAKIYEIESYKITSDKESDNEGIVEIPIIEEVSNEDETENKNDKEDDNSSLIEENEKENVSVNIEVNSDNPPAKEKPIAEARRETVFKSRGVDPSAVKKKKKKKKPLISKDVNHILLPLVLIIFVIVAIVLLRIGVDILWIGVQGYKPLPLVALILAVLISKKYIKSTIKNGTAKEVLNYYHNKVIEELENQEIKEEE